MTTPLLANANAVRIPLADFSQKPSDWERVYTVEVDGRTLEAMKFLASYVLKSKLPSLSAISAADCVHCFQESTRKTSDDLSR